MHRSSDFYSTNKPARSLFKERIMRSFQTRLGFALLSLIALTLPVRADEYRSIEREVDKVLQKRDIGDVSAEYARSAPKSLEDWLNRLSVFGRAGHNVRVHTALTQLAAVPDRENSPFSYQLRETARRAVAIDDFPSRKLYYENIELGGDEHIPQFMRAWINSGDVGGLDKWLEAKAGLNESWFDHWLNFRFEQGTSDPLWRKLEDGIRADPSNWYGITRYISLATDSGHRYGTRDITWLIDSPVNDSSYRAYRIAGIFQNRDNALAIRLLERSLNLPFKSRDTADYSSQLHHAAAPREAVDPEKQVRFWTKTALARLYKETGQPLKAQPLVEELAAMKMEPYEDVNSYALAGGVQAASGYRVVEAKILQDEATNQGSPAYWIQRAAYYGGRGEKETVWTTYRHALEIFPYVRGDLNTSRPRIEIVNRIVAFDRYSDRDITSGILRKEVKAALEDAHYLFELAKLIDTDWDEVRDEFFVNEDVLPRMMAARPKWYGHESSVIEAIMGSEAWTPAMKQAAWGRLAALARRDLLHRGSALAKAMSWEGENKHVIPILREYLKIAPERAENNDFYDRQQCADALFDAYLESGVWQAAEKMYLAGYEGSTEKLGDSLRKIALSAANAGRTEDALRLWKAASNIDRWIFRDFEYFAKPPLIPGLRQFYVDMKKADPLTSIPDRALAILK